MKKILVISANPAPPIQAGNQKCIIEYCNLLHNIGCEVYFLYIEGRQKAPIEMFNYWGENYSSTKTTSERHNQANIDSFKGETFGI